MIKRPNYIRRCFLAGFIFWMPIIAAIFVINLIVRFLDRGLNLLPSQYQPGQLLGITIPGISLVTIIIILLLTGVIASNLIGAKLIKIWDKLLEKLPLVNSFYHAIKSFLDNVFSADKIESFTKVLLVQYPHEGLWTVAFQTGAGFTAGEQVVGEPLVNIFVPTTPNPASGFMMTLPKSQAKVLDMTVDEGLQFVLSLGASRKVP